MPKLPLSDRGTAYAQQRRYAKAISDFTEAIRLDPNSASAYYNRGVACAKTRKANADFATANRLKAGQQRSAS